MSTRIPYSIVLPPGWVRLAVTEPGDPKVMALATKLVAPMPPEQRPRMARILRDHLEASIAQARENNALDVYFPTEPVEGSPLPMSIVVAEAQLPAKAQGASHTDALLHFGSKPGAEAKSIDGRLAVRSIGRTDAILDDNGNVVTPATKRISYLVSTGGDAPALLLVVGSVVRLEADETGEFAEALEFLFDSMVTTIRFLTAVVAV